jgi:cation diffusion facilitator CzcD-associated flavoprotein CzcO
MTTRNQTLDILIIGAGQAGLALGYHLKNTSLRFQLVEGHQRIGDSWRTRYDSLVLFTPRTFSALPGLRVSGDPEGYPTKDEIADYLEGYADHFALPVLVNTPIRRLERTDEGFRATTGTGKTVTFKSRETATVETVIWATGYQEQTDWIAIPQAKDAQGHLRHQRGISPVPGLYVIGRSWQWTRGSALLTGVGDDALYLTKHLLHQFELDTASSDATGDKIEV